METLVPNRLLFRFEFPIRYRKSPVIDGDLSDWSDEFLVPDFGAMDDEPAFGKIYLAWNETGLFIACGVEGRRSGFQCDAKSFWKGDNLRLCTDMRDTRDIKRGSRYCQQFYFLPAGGGRDGRSPVAGGARIVRATENAPPVGPGLVKVAGQRDGLRYTLEGHIPAAALSGFDPDEHKRIGVYTLLEDRDLGQQHLTVGDDLNWYLDPSMWVTGLLAR
jgi:hypothetical protein